MHTCPAILSNFMHAPQKLIRTMIYKSAVEIAAKDALDMYNAPLHSDYGKHLCMSQSWCGNIAFVKFIATPQHVVAPCC
jgi:hypothetical protein